jgi:hypothetical protein
LTWPHILLHFPGRSLKSMTGHYAFLNLTKHDFDLVAIPRPTAKVGGKWMLEDQKLLMNLKGKRLLSWPHILLHFPGRSTGCLRGRYSKSNMVNPVVCPHYKSKETNRLVHLKQMGYSWSQLLEHFPGRTDKSLQIKYFSMRGVGKHRRPYEEKEIEIILDMREYLGFTWKKIAEHIPGRDKGALAEWHSREKRKYSNLTSNQQNCSSLQAPPAPKRRKLQ